MPDVQKPKPPPQPDDVMPVAGDQIWYYPGSGVRYDDFAYFDASQPCAGIVTYVHHARYVNCTVSDQNSKPFHETGIIFVQAGDSLPPTEPYAVFPSVPTPTQRALQAQNSASSERAALQRELDLKAGAMHPHPTAVERAAGHARIVQEKWVEFQDKSDAALERAKEREIGELKTALPLPKDKREYRK